jgi:hypothetical protein
MKLFSWRSIAAASVGLVIGMVGCSKEPPPKVLTTEEVQTTMKDAFKESPPEVTNMVNEAVTSADTDQPKSLERLQQISAQPGLTPEQQKAATDATMALLRKLRENADNGDKKAQAALDRYRATK